MSEKNSKRIILGSDGNPRKQAARNPYSPSSDSRPVRRNPPKPYLAHGIHKKAGFIKTGQLSAGTSSGASAGGGPVQSMAQSPLYYDYRWSTPDKFYFPRNRVVANSIWRQVYIRDATIAVATDMYSELPWSGFDLIGIDDASIKKTYEDMFNELDIVPKMTDFTRDFLILGEVILHSIFNSRKGYWERVISHNPDYVRVEGVGLVTEQPLMWMRPTPEIKRLLGSPDKRVRKLQQIIPREMLNAFRRNQEVPLDDLNTTFLARKVNSTDVRGTSLYTRLYRTIMYEDFVVNASLAVSQRMAAPLRIFKLGDPQTGWLPDANDEAEFAEMLSMAESDPLACIVTHNNVSVDLVGVADRALLISKEWDFLERIKLLAMGVAKSFLLGEASFACFAEGTPVIKEDGTPCSIENIKIGDYVLDKFGKPQKVINNWCEGVPEELCEIKVWGGQTFNVTKNHRFPAWTWPTKCSCGCGKKVKNVGRRFYSQKHAAKASRQQFNTIQCEAFVHHGRHKIDKLPKGYDPNRIINAEELRKGDFLKVPRTTKLENSKNDPYLNLDTARLLGYYLAEGNICRSTLANGEIGNPCEIRLTFGVHELGTWINDVQAICSRLNIRCEVAHWKGKESTRTVRIIPKDKEFVKWFAIHGGEKSSKKRLSKEALSWDEIYLKEVILGHARGDGCKSDIPSPSQKLRKRTKSLATVQIGTTSKFLASQLLLLFARFGFPAGKAIAISKDTKYNRQPYNIIRIQGKAAIDFCKFVWGKTLNARYNSCRVWCDDSYMYLPIMSNKIVKNTKPVYNLTVENTHTYLVCNGIATCNSAIAGIQMLLERVLVLRNMFENTWINKKLCQPVAEMNDFYKRPKSELDHRIRVKTKDEMELIVPTIKWKKSLDPAQDTAILGIWRDLKERGILSDRTYASGANVDIDVERKNQKEEKTYVEEHPDLFGIPEAPEGGGGGMAPGGKPPAGGKPQGPGGKSPPGGGGMPPPMPLPGGSKNLKKTGTATDSLYYSVEEELLDLADKKGNVNVEDAMEIFEDIIEKKAEIKKVLDKAEHSSTARKEKNLLVGKSIG